jgi:hypothetical protein
MHCKDCQFWTPYLEYFDRVKPSGCREEFGGICTSHLIDEDCGSDSNHLENALTYPYQEGGYFWTGAKFGCVNFEEKI